MQVLTTNVYNIYSCKGILPGLLGVSHGAFQFMAYEQCKRYVDNMHTRQQHKHISGTFTLNYTPVETMCMAAISKTFAAVITYPYQVVRSRLQDHRSVYTGAVDCVVQTWKQEGIRGFYRGLAVNVVKVTPQAITVFVVYESIQSYLKQNAVKQQQQVNHVR
jgi:solute carrier family 25 folate transporter 32